MPIFDLLNSASFLSQLELVNTNLGLVNTKLSDIYDRLHHVEVDSYVNVRVMDITGELPLPASEVSGLLVSAYAAGPPAPTHVIVDSGNIDALVSGTADNPIYVTSTPFNPFVIATITNSVFVRTDGSFPFNVNVTNSSLNVNGSVSIDGTVAVTGSVAISGSVPVTQLTTPWEIAGNVSIGTPVTVQNQLFNVRDGTWWPALGMNVTSVGINDNSPTSYTLYSNGGAVALAAPACYGPNSQPNIVMQLPSANTVSMVGTRSAICIEPA